MTKISWEPGSLIPLEGKCCMAVAASAMRKIDSLREEAIQRSDEVLRIYEKCIDLTSENKRLSRENRWMKYNLTKTSANPEAAK